MEVVGRGVMREKSIGEDGKGVKTISAGRWGLGISGVAVADGGREKSEGTAVMKISGIRIVGFGNRERECSRMDSVGRGRDAEGNLGGGGSFGRGGNGRCAWELRGILVAGRGGRRWRRMGLWGG